MKLKLDIPTSRFVSLNKCRKVVILKYYSRKTTSYIVERYFTAPDQYKITLDINKDLLEEYNYVVDVEYKDMAGFRTESIRITNG